MEKRGQITIFVILGLMIVIAGILIFLFYPKIQTTYTFDENNPNNFIQNCLEDEIQNTIKELSLQGGSLDPEHYILYDETKVEYLCYTEEYYLTCIVQRPLLINHIESEIKNSIEESAKECFKDLKESYEKENYETDLREGPIEVDLMPGKIKITFNNSLSLKKEDTVNYNSFDIFINNNIYEVATIVTSILTWESKYGDSEVTTYMNYYRDLKVEKKKQSEGSTVYIITDRDTEDKFQFASRSLAWPAGYPQ